MAATEAEVLPTQQLTLPEDYQFTGDVSTVENKCRFLDAFRIEGSIYHAALAIGIHRTTVYKWLERDPAFATALDDGREDNYDQAETSVFKKALAGDSLLLMFYLKAHRHKFRDRVSIDVEVVRNEIEERMNQLNLRQLPAMTTEFLSGADDLHTEAVGVQTVEVQQIRPSCDNLQKDPPLHNPPSDE